MEDPGGFCCIRRCNMRRLLAVTLIALVAIGLIGFAQVGTRTNPIKMILVPSTP